MKNPIAVLSTLFFLLLLVSPFNGRQGPEDFWKSVMADQAMPGAIKGMLENSHKIDAEVSSANRIQDHVNKNFDTKGIAIIYHHQTDNGG
ncbi:hypothetical protein AKJ16_DCAP15715 [Drosera capensis]